MTVAVLIPAKGKSKRIPRKNLQKIGEYTLVERCVRETLRCKKVDRIILDTDSDEIVELCAPFVESDDRFTIQQRSTELIGDNVGTPELCVNLLNKEEDIDHLGIMHVTAAYLSHQSLDRATEMYVAGTGNYDSLFTVEVLHDYLWKDKPLNFNVDCRTSTDNVDVYYKLTGGYFISSREYILKNKTFIGRNPILFPVPVLECLDINYPDELELAQIINAGMKALGKQESHQ